MAQAARPAHRILIVDDEDVARAGLERILAKPDYAIDQASNGQDALDRILKQGEDYALVLADYRMPGIDGLELLRTLKAERPLIQVVLITGAGTIDVAVEAMKDGAYDFIQKPFDVILIRSVVERAMRERHLEEENVYLRRQLARHLDSQTNFVWEDTQMKKLLQLVGRIGPTQNPVLIEGESGTGKELLARAIHEVSSCKDHKFMAINCGAFPEDLLVSELFGHEKGAFTGAESRKPGVFEAVAGGTIFLDEIGDMPFSMQSAFLRVLQEKELYRVGGREVVKVDFRLIAATNRNLKSLVEAGKFREDLFFRLRVHYLELPALRDRYADIAPLAQFFVKKYMILEQRPAGGISEEAMRILQSYDWPGNVRELENVVRAMVVTSDKATLDVADIPEFILDGMKDESDVQTLEDLKMSHIKGVLKMVNGNRTRAAKLLGIPRITLQRLVARHPELAEIR